jgi:DNA-binding beta-propeller fold protein YncE
LAGTACLLLALALACAASVRAERPLLSEAALETTECARCTGSVAAGRPAGEGQIEGPCGLAISAAGSVYLADYYHRVIDVFGAPSASAPGQYLSQIALPGSNPRLGVNTLDSVCGLAFDSAGDLYGNEWHQDVLRLSGGAAKIDGGESTGLAIDSSTDRLYVDDRTYVAEYELPFTVGDSPTAKIGLGHLGDGYGLAAAAGHVYLADAADQTVKVFAPATSTTAPVATIAGRFNSLTDAALAIDPTNGHLLVVDDLQPGFEHPRSAVLEFDSPAAGYAYLGRLPGDPVAGGPSGIAVAPSGRLLVTDGNGELSNAFLYGPYQEAGFAPTFAPPSPESAPSPDPVTLGLRAGTGEDPAARRRPSQTAAASEVSQRGGIRISFQGRLLPRRLPRRGSMPVTATVGAKIAAVGGHAPPQLRGIEIAINRNGHFAPDSLPACRIDQIQPATTTAALAACRHSLVGEGTFSARVLIPAQAPFPSTGKVYAFNGRWHGHQAILAHVYGTEPVPVSYTLPFELLPQRGTYGTLLRAALPAVTGDSGYVTGLSLNLGRAAGAGGYLTAGCPVPAGFPGALFPFAHVKFSFAGGRAIDSTLIRECKARG